MKAATIIEKPKVEISSKLMEELEHQINEAGQVVVHCFYQASSFYGDKIRIWKTTYLFDHHSSHRSEMVHTHNISLYPIWTTLMPNQLYSFTLIFSGLPKTCTLFDLVEQIPASGAFELRNIKRNKTDVYYVRI